MGNEHLIRWDSFVYTMWQKNCTERDDWCQPPLTRQEYEEQYGEWLEDKFFMQIVDSHVNA